MLILGAQQSDIQGSVTVIGPVVTVLPPLRVPLNLKVPLWAVVPPLVDSQIQRLLILNKVFGVCIIISPALASAVALVVPSIYLWSINPPQPPFV